MLNKIPILVFNGYFKGTKEKQAELYTYATFDDQKTTWNIVDSKDVDYKFYSHKKPSYIKHSDNSVSYKSMIRKTDTEGNTIYITVYCLKSRDKQKGYRYDYSVSIVIACFDKYTIPNNYYLKLKETCLKELLSTYDTFLVCINKLRDKGFAEISKEEEKGNAMKKYNNIE